MTRSQLAGMVCFSCAMGLWLFYTNGLECHCLFGRHVVAFICHFVSVFFPLPLHLCFLSFSQWSSCGWNPVNVIGLVLSFRLLLFFLILPGFLFFQFWFFLCFFFFLAAALVRLSVSLSFILCGKRLMLYGLDCSLLLYLWHCHCSLCVTGMLFWQHFLVSLFFF